MIEGKVIPTDSIANIACNIIIAFLPACSMIAILVHTEETYAYLSDARNRTLVIVNDNELGPGFLEVGVLHSEVKPLVEA